MSRAAFKARLIAGILFALTLAGAGLAIFPYYWMIVSSLAPKSMFEWPPHLLPATVSFAAYLKVFAERPVGRWIANTSTVAVATSFFCTIVAVNAGYALSRFRGRLLSGFGILILVSQMLPAALIAVPLYIVYRQLGLYNSLIGLALGDTVFVLPLATWLMKGFFDGIPADLEQQAEVDGCTRLGAFYRITLPLALPGVIVVVVFSFMAGWDEFFLARTLISSQSNWVLSVGLTSFISQYTIAWDEMMAAAAVFALPAAFFFLIVQRYLVDGLTGGAVKG